MKIFKLEELNTLSEAREAYASLLTAYEASLSEKATFTQAHEKALAEAEALREDLDAANEMLDEAGKEKLIASTELENLKAQLEQAQAGFEATESDLAKSLEQMKGLQEKVSKLEAEAKSAEARAAQICASVGVEPARISPDGEPKQQSLIEQMRAIENPAEQMAFFRKHKDAILKGR